MELSMSKEDQKQKKITVSHNTEIGTVTGQVHTGSGNIIVHNFTAESKVSTKDEFLAALRAFSAEVEAAHEQGLPSDTADDVIIELNAAGLEVSKDEPKSERVVRRLERAKSAIVAVTGLATATSAAISAGEKFLPMIEKAIKIAGSLF
jgi:hypothetical protein